MTYILRHWKQNRKLTIKIKRDKRENSKRKAVQYLILCTIVDILRDKKNEQYVAESYPFYREAEHSLTRYTSRVKRTNTLQLLTVRVHCNNRATVSLSADIKRRPVRVPLENAGDKLPRKGL